MTTVVEVVCESQDDIGPDYEYKPASHGPSKLNRGCSSLHPKYRTLMDDINAQFELNTAIALEDIPASLGNLQLLGEPSHFLGGCRFDRPGYRGFSGLLPELRCPPASVSLLLAVALHCISAASHGE